MHDPLIDLATVPPVALHPAVLAARAPLDRIVADLLTVPDGALDRPWRWRSADVDELDVRYGVYRIHERFEAAIAAIAVGRGDGPGAVVGPAIPPLAAMAVARWELHGALAPLSDAEWDADPGGGEWTVRRTVGHIISGQRSYGWYNAWYLSRRAIEGEAVYPPDGTLPPEPSEEDEAAGATTGVRARLDEVVDATVSANAGLDRAAMRVGARWSGLPVPIDFRLGRYGSHLREHTVQVDKTLAVIGRQPTEVERLVRLILASYGRLEAQFVGRSVEELERPFADGTTALTVLDAAVADAMATVASVREAAAT